MPEADYSTSYSIPVYTDLMYLNPKSTLYGLPALQLRGLLRGLPTNDSRCWKPFDWRKAPGLDEPGRERLEAELLRDGYIERTPYSRSEDAPERRYYMRTEKGSRLANASGRQYRREAAERSLKRLVERAHGINGGDYAYRVEKLVVFGSLLSDADRVSDVDVAFKLRRLGPPVKNHADFEVWQARYTERCPYGGLRALFWPLEEVQRQLKGGDPIVSLTPLDKAHEEMLRGQRQRVVFGRGRTRGPTAVY